MFGIPIDFILFGLTLLGVALFHRHTLVVALAGLAAIAIQRSRLQDSRAVPASRAFVSHLGHEWVISRQPALPAHGLRIAFSPFRKESRAGDPAQVSPALIGRAASSCSSWFGFFPVFSITSRAR